MRVRLWFLPVIALAAATVDTVLVRQAQPHRPADGSVLVQAVLIWLVFALLAYLPARLCAGLCASARARFRRDPAVDRAASPSAERSAAVAGALFLTLFTTLPVIAHTSLARHIQSAGDLSALREARPWLELGATLAAAVAVAWLVAALARRLPAVALPGLVLLGAGLVGFGFPRESGSSASSDPPTLDADASRPNILLLIWDTTRAKSLSSYGYERATTPFLEQLAGRATVFEEARSVSSFTYTSHLSMLTGVYPSHHGGRLTRMSYDPERTPSVARILNDAGYRTAAFVGTGVLRANTGMIEGFETFDDRVDPPVCDTRAWALVHDVQALLAGVHPAFRGNGNPHWLETFQRPASEVLDKAREWIQSDDPRPWFCMVNLYDVHWPYLPSGAGREQFVRAYSGRADGYLFRSDDYVRTPGKRKGELFTEADDQHLTDLYDAEMYNLDRDVADFLETALRPEEPTALLLTSDHGEAFGEQEAYGHHGVLEAQVRIPMLLMRPGGPAGRVSERVSGVDVGTTLLSLAGLPIPEHMTGRDLTRPVGMERPVLVEHRDTERPKDAQYSIYHGAWKLTRNGTFESDRFELYDLERDPAALHDVAAEHPERVRELAALLVDTQARWGGDREDWSGEGEARGDHLKALGYGGDDTE